MAGPRIGEGRRAAQSQSDQRPFGDRDGQFRRVASGIDRFPNLGAAAGVPNNVHALIPNEVKIKAGGTVNFIIAGFHLVAVYDDGTQPDDINTALTVPPTTQPVPPLIDDPANRVYRGIDPSVLPLLQGPTQQGPMGPPFQPVLQDRVEVVHFPNPGRFLVICAVLPHFNEGMIGYVRVIP
jgi:plastocyanin